MGALTYYWTEGTFIYDNESNQTFVCTDPSQTSGDPQTQGLRSDTIIPSFTWTKTTTDATVTEMLGTGRIWTSQSEDSLSQKRRFSLLKANKPSCMLEIQTVAKSTTGDFKIWKTILGVTYPSDIYMQYATTSTLSNTSGATSWTIAFATGTLDSYFDYIKHDVTGAAGTEIHWKSTAIYTMVDE